MFLFFFSTVKLTKGPSTEARNDEEELKHSELWRVKKFFAAFVHERICVFVVSVFSESILAQIGVVTSLRASSLFSDPHADGLEVWTWLTSQPWLWGKKARLMSNVFAEVLMSFAKTWLPEGRWSKLANSLKRCNGLSVPKRVLRSSSMPASKSKPRRHHKKCQRSKIN